MFKWLSGSDEGNNPEAVVCRYTRNDDGEAIDVYATVGEGKEYGPLTDSSIVRLYEVTTHQSWSDDDEYQTRVEGRRGWFW